MNDEQPKPSRPLRRWAGRFALLYLLIVIGVVVWFRSAADEHWLATLLLFGPRWLAAAPLLLLVPIALFTRSRLGLLWCAIAIAIIAGPFMSGVVSLTPELQPARVTSSVRIITFNADNKEYDRKRLQTLFDEYAPDLLALQDANRILQTDMPAGYQLHAASNGLKLASKLPAVLVGDFSDDKLGAARGAAKFRIAFASGEREIAVVHLPTPRDGLEAILARKPNAVQTLQGVIKQREESSALVKQWLGDCPLVVGDFNLPPESVIYRRDWANYQNAFSERGLGWGWTMFSRRGSVRIDHILYASPWQCQSLRVGPDLGSAHRPVIADFAQ